MPTPASPTTVTSRPARGRAAASSCRAQERRARPRGRRAATRSRARGVASADQAVGGHALGLALQLERLDRLGLDRVAHERVGELAEQRLLRRRGLLEPGGDVDRVAGREPLVAGGLAGDDLAGVDAGADRHRDAVVALELDVQRVEPGAHVERRADGPQGVVLVRLRHPEHGHDGVADELLDRPAVALDGRRA